MSTENVSVEIVVSPKSLERQIKLLDDRIGELQAEMSALEKKREACHVLLGIPLTAVGAPVEVAVAPVKKSAPKKKKELSEDSEEEVDVIRPSDMLAGATADELSQH